MALLAVAEAASMDTMRTRPPVDEPHDDRRALIRGSASGGQGLGNECGPDLHTVCGREATCTAGPSAMIRYWGTDIQQCVLSECTSMVEHASLEPIYGPL